MIKTIHTAINQVLELDLRDMASWKRFIFRFTQIFLANIRDLTDGQLSLRAMSLVYTTLITLVPLLAISFSVLKGFGVHNQLEKFLPAILEGLGPDKAAEITTRVIGFVDNIKVGVLGALGLGLLLYAVIALMKKIEAAFNHIWRVGQDRTFSQRFSDYLSVLMMGPVLIFMSAGITTTIRHSPVIKGTAESMSLGWLFDFTSLLIPWFVLAVGFTFFYVYMPNRKVKLSAAFTGALVAALLWKTMGFVFASFIAGSANYVAIYAAFATLIVLMIWIYASWMVILIGSNVSFYVQYPRFLPISRESLVLSPYMRLKLGLNILVHITQSHYKNGKPWGADRLSRKMNVPILAIQQVLDHLESGNILTASKTEPTHYLPACPFETTPLKTVVDVLERAGEQGWLHTERMSFAPEVTKLMKTMDEAREKAILSKSITQVLLSSKA